MVKALREMGVQKLKEGAGPGIYEELSIKKRRGTPKREDTLDVGYTVIEHSGMATDEGPLIHVMGVTSERPSSCEISSQEDL